MSSERAFQQLDPLGALIGRPLTFLAAAGVPIYAAMQTLFGWQEIDYPLLAVASLVLIIAACVLLDFASNALRAPFTRTTQLVVTGTAVLALAFNAASVWNSNSFVRDDWGPFAVGLVLLAMTQYRPALEIAQTGLAVALLVGVLALLQAHSQVTPIPAICFALIAVTPILTLSLASASFAYHLVGGLERWRSRARSAVSAFREENNDVIARSVQQDRVSVLNQEVVPFFAGVLSRGAIREVDREQARKIADSIRSVMVAEVDRTWLDAVIEHATGIGLDEPVAGHPGVADPGGLAMRMNTDQRTVVRAIVVALCASPACDPRELRIALTRKGARCSAVLHAGLITTNHLVRDELAPYLAVMKILFSDLKVRFTEYTVELRFSYEEQQFGQYSCHREGGWHVLLAGQTRDPR